MKNVIIILTAVLLITAINACTLQEIPESGNPGAITITGQTVLEQAMSNLPGSKTILSGVETHWVNGDKIGVFSPEAKPTSESAPPTKNAESTALTETPAKSSSFTSSLVWGSDSDHHFYAYYPYGTEYTSAQTAEVPISLASAQNQSGDGNKDHIGALDFMVATPLTVASGGAVSLTFNHVFVMIEFQIKGSGTLSQISLSGANPLACAGTIDLTQSAPAAESPYSITTTSTSKYVTVTLGSGASLNSETATSVYMMILPGPQSENLQIAVKIDGNWKEMSKPQPDGGFVRGKKYLVTLNTAGAGWNAAIQDSRDSQIYQYKTIGTQVWMTENLAYLPSVVGPATESVTDPYYYVYGYDGTVVDDAKATSNYTIYGVLYNWTAALSACPPDWHLPSDAEWTTLTDYLGGESVAGGKMKEAGIAHWWSPNTGATNESGFTALPGGCRYYDGAFTNFRTTGYWWSSTQHIDGSAGNRNLSYANSSVGKPYGYLDYGFSVRCLQD
jgi:uncharacterized protein (TIGR02145 family)